MAEIYLQLVLQQVLFVGELAVETEELGLLGRHFLCIVSDLGFQRGSNASSNWAAQGPQMTYANVHLVLLVGVHLCGRVGVLRCSEMRMTWA